MDMIQFMETYKYYLFHFSNSSESDSIDKFLSKLSDI